ncbi:MAG: glycogen synthase GlgA [Ruminococcaceae bacterium]|nr:glycogen synthase GlgA [Oscillospiraceae bacterium]
MKKVLFAAAEALPFISTGGLADVVGSLPAALVKKGVDARVVLPLYGTMNEKFRKDLVLVKEIEVQLSWRKQYCGIYKTEHNGVTFYFIDNEFYFKRDSLYGSFDDGERFAFFSKCILDIMPHIDFYPDVLHANDWQTAPAVIYLRCNYGHIPEYQKIRTVYSIHNIAYQGIYNLGTMGDVFGINGWDRSIVEYDGCLNLTKGAIVCCDRLSTVSPHYAEEIKTAEFAHGLQYIINESSYKLSGILNGIDVNYYNSEIDPEIPYNFNADDFSGKAKDKAALQEELGLPVDPDVPVVSMITRLVSHKGLDLVECVLEEIIAKDKIQFVLLGTGEANYEAYFRNLEAKYPEKVRAIIKYDKTLSKKIYAASDIFLMPSKSEPCGLAQMICSRYATVPVVRETGGLYDSIRSYNEFTGEGNGFTFTNYNAHDMMYTIRRAMAFYRNKEEWNKIMKKAISEDFSWAASSESYIELYESIF